MTRRLVAALVALAIAVGALSVIWLRRRGLPASDSAAYAQTTRAFYRGLAALDVGLLDNARLEFTTDTTLAPREPAGWADLGLASLRLGEFDAAAAALDRAERLAPDNGGIQFLFGRLETARGRRDEGLARLRRAVELDPGNARARIALAQEIEAGAAPGADAQAAQLIDDQLARTPGNIALIVERARLAAKQGDGHALTTALAQLEPAAAGWPPEVVAQYQTVRQAAGAGRLPDAAREMAFLRNVLARVPAYLDARRTVTPSAELIAEPFRVFLRLPVPGAAPSPADGGLTFTASTPEGGNSVIRLPGDEPEVRSMAALSLDGDQPPAIVATSRPAVAVLDWNHDFRMDVVAGGDDGVQLFLQGADGRFADATPVSDSRKMGTAGVAALWPADVEMDGDLDVVAATADGDPIVLRNNGDGTWQPIAPFTGAGAVRAFGWGDLDADGDPDAVFVDARGALHLFENLQAGQFRNEPLANDITDVRALAIGDVDADGVLDAVVLDGRGAVERVSKADGRWTHAPMASWRDAAPGDPPASGRLFLADLDNNGALDVVASGSSGTGVWLADDHLVLQPRRGAVNAEIWAVTDFGLDGQLDLAGLAGDAPVRLTGHATRGYHYAALRPRAQRAAGDQRINSFGIGGEVDVRSGRLVQKQLIAGPVVHLGLGSHGTIDVARIVWPNGVPQAEFDPPADRPIVADQRLKGSCPWVFADNGQGLQFITDFLWRSPLGLRINAQDTAGVTQTEDWVMIRGAQLAPKRGAYDVRITAELWETHFIDAVSLMVVDHPRETAVFVDERFSRQPPALAVRTLTPPQPVVDARDQDGREVTDLVRRQDGRYLSTFARGTYQGVAADHFVEFDTGVPVRAGTPPVWLVASGWIYPTDSSINVAIGQGRAVQPHGLSLEAQDAAGRWIVVAPDLGFPAGKNKTILVDLSAAAGAAAGGAHRFRLRTNLEIYWDALSVARPADSARTHTARVAASIADLRFRGFSVTRQDRRDTPETPEYDRIANVAPRWRDLVGYYTRYGDVRELLGAVEDRYVIMNAGDELRLSFPVPAPPPEGWARDFVLVGDGWEKDGDFNTGFSKTVLPLPRHGQPDYRSTSATPVLEQDPVYRRYPDDWRTFHTRYVTPDRFLEGLREHR
jgi:tetratricopeptide (TPR) repeat protein